MYCTCNFPLSVVLVYHLLHCLLFFNQAVENGFASFHLYVCAAFLKQFSKDIVEETDFQVCFIFSNF